MVGNSQRTTTTTTTISHRKTKKKKKHSLNLKEVFVCFTRFHRIHCKAIWKSNGKRSSAVFHTFLTAALCYCHCHFIHIIFISSSFACRLSLSFFLSNRSEMQFHLYFSVIDFLYYFDAFAKRSNMYNTQIYTHIFIYICSKEMHIFEMSWKWLSM